MDIFTNSIQELKGIGPAKAKLFKKLKIELVEDLLYNFPRGYKDKSQVTDIADIEAEGYYTLKVTISGKASENRVRSGLIIIKCVAFDETGKISIVWFNNKFMKNLLKQGDSVLLYGKVKKIGKELTIDNPELEKSDKGESLNLLRIVPEYPLTDGLHQKDVRKAVMAAYQMTENQLLDLFPEEIRKMYQLAEINFSIKNIHYPDSEYNLELARRRLIFEELFMLQSGLIHIKRTASEVKTGITFKKANYFEEFLKNLPFNMTTAQIKACEDVINDMEKPKVMNRLIQGDVGSGKTVVAMAALFNCVKNGYQGILMAPTEILAEQHLLTFKSLLSKCNINIGILKGSMRKKEKNATLESLKNGETQILIATHAVIEDNVEFYKLGLVVTDEQHRFGVRQRTVLSAKGNNPDMLVMSATPIPRTLTLAIYGDLDISIIDELPPGRQKIDTFYVNSTKKDRMFNFIKKELDAGRQGYVVCPLVAESEKMDLNSASEYSEYLRNEHFQKYNVGILHGRMKSDEKDRTMNEFRDGKIQLLVSTTVIEVGVNIENATIMVIENADRFGMAQLHQLRGRVGRAEHKSYCILVSDTENNDAVERLKFMTKNENGFEIAQKDLELRGGGEILGLRQHGLPELMIADLARDIKLLQLSREAVLYIYENNKLDLEEYKRMSSILDARFEKKLKEVALN